MARLTRVANFQDFLPVCEILKLLAPIGSELLTMHAPETGLEKWIWVVGNVCWESLGEETL